MIEGEGCRRLDLWAVCLVVTDLSKGQTRALIIRGVAALPKGQRAKEAKLVLQHTLNRAERVRRHTNRDWRQVNLFAGSETETHLAVEMLAKKGIPTLLQPAPVFRAMAR